MLRQPRFEWHRRIVHTALNHLIRHLPIPILPNVPHSASCGVLEGCLKATPSFPTLTVWVGCQQRTVHLGLSVFGLLWLKDGAELLLDPLRQLCRERDVPFKKITGTPSQVRLRIGRRAEACERAFWMRTMDDPSRILPLAPLLAMEWAERMGADVDWTAFQVIVHEDRLLTDHEAATLTEVYLVALQRISLRAAQEAPSPDPVARPVPEHPASLRVH